MHSDAVNAVLDQLGNPAKPPCAQALDSLASIHFMSMIVAPARDEEKIAHLVIHAGADGHPRAALASLAKVMADPLLDVLKAMGIAAPKRDRLGAYLEEYRVEVDLGWLASFGWFATTGLAFAGTPGMSVARVNDEAALADQIRLLLDADTAPGSALAKLERVRGILFADPAFKWAFLCEPVPLLGEAKLFTDSVWPLVKAAFRDFLSPLIWPPVLVFMWSRLVEKNALDNALWHMALCVVIELLIAGIVVLIGYGILRRQEEADAPFDVEPSQDEMRKILKRENQPGFIQNHLGGVSILKPGLVRRVTLRLALWLIGESGTRRSRPGFIDKIGSIHFAQWLRLPGTTRLVFLSNYDGSWQSYLEDFIARLREGLTSVWSNTRDFPKTTNLIAGGAGDGARFKRWARRQQVPTRFWYSAYPHLANSHVRTHAAIRHGFVSASDEGEAAKWLALFGYAQPASVETEEVPTLVFGGLPRLRFAHCLVFGFGEARDFSWLREIEPCISYGAQLPDAALAVGFTRGGLTKLGLDDNALASFPTAFQQGMAAPGRALGDQDTAKWRWGRIPEGSNETDVDAVLMIYAKTAGELIAQVDGIRELLAEAKYVPLDEIQLTKVPEKDQTTRVRDVREAFGFRDGISQPVMRGSRDWSKPENAIHVVEPGELVLGYRDNLGMLAPSPRSYGRDIGRNGTFLVVRQLAQDIDGFRQYLDNAATQYNGDPRIPAAHRNAPADWIAAKMVGRWQDGSSLVRNPDAPDDHRQDNDFMFGWEDPDGLRCPLGAHIRRANPRDSFDPGSAVQLAIANRHRILRVGRSYPPQNGMNAGGLLFMCVNADIERQFEFLQQTWLLGSNFHGLNNEIDPVVGYRDDGDAMTVPTPHGPVRLQQLSKFVSVLGGAYFFMPGRSAMRMLLERAPAPKPGAAAKPGAPAQRAPRTEDDGDRARYGTP